jgi:diphthamide synthase subunit DPH2
MTNTATNDIREYIRLASAKRKKQYFLIIEFLKRSEEHKYALMVVVLENMNLDKKNSMRFITLMLVLACAFQY